MPGLCRRAGRRISGRGILRDEFLDQVIEELPTFGWIGFRPRRSSRHDRGSPEHQATVTSGMLSIRPATPGPLWHLIAANPKARF